MNVSSRQRKCMHDKLTVMADMAALLYACTFIESLQS